MNYLLQFLLTRSLEGLYFLMGILVFLCILCAEKDGFLWISYIFKYNLTFANFSTEE